MQTAKFVNNKHIFLVLGKISTGMLVAYLSNSMCGRHLPFFGEDQSHPVISPLYRSKYIITSSYPVMKIRLRSLRFQKYYLLHGRDELQMTITLQIFPLLCFLWNKTISLPVHSSSFEISWLLQNLSKTSSFERNNSRTSRNRSSRIV